MKKILIVVSILSSVIGFSQKSDSLKLKLNSFEVEFFGGALYHSSKDYSNFKPFYKNEIDFQSVLEGDSIVINHNYSGSGTSGSSGMAIYGGFIPYSKKQNQYSLNQEIKFGLGYSKFYTPSLSRSYATETTIDSLLTYSISESTGDTLSSSKTAIDSINRHQEFYHYLTNKLMIMGEWDYKFNPTNRLVVSLGAGARMSYLFGGYVYYNYSNRYQIYNELSSSSSNSITTSIYDEENELVSKYSINPTQNGLAFEPYLKGNIEFKLGMKDNFMSHLSLNGKGYIGGAFHKVFNITPVITEILYGASIGLKYSL